jgi:TolA-binding protein
MVPFAVMRGVGRRSLVILTAIASLASSAWAQVTNSEEPSTDGTSPDESPVERSPESPVVDEALVARLLQRLDALRTENEQLRERLELLEEDHAYLEQKVSELAPVAAKVTGFLDVGFFSVTGDGSGIRLDVGNRHFPEYRPSAASGHSCRARSRSTASRAAPRRSSSTR